MFRYSFIFQCIQLDLYVRSERLASCRILKTRRNFTTEGRADADLAAQKRSKNELEFKVKDQV